MSNNSENQRNLIAAVIGWIRAGASIPEIMELSGLDVWTITTIYNTYNLKK